MSHVPRLARRHARPLAAATVVALTVRLAGAAAPASAESTAANDPADATASLTDIRRVTVDHGPEQVITKAGPVARAPRSASTPASRKAPTTR